MRDPGRLAKLGTNAKEASALSQATDPVGHEVAIVSAGHGGRSPDRHGTVLDVFLDAAGEPSFLVVEWLDGSLSVVPASACSVE